MSDLDAFRKETRSWLQANCPEGARGPGQIASGSTKIKLEPDVAQWLSRMAERGWTAPTWPTEYGGGGLSPTEARVLQDEMARIHARTPLMGMGLAMIGPTLLEFGTADQRQRHLPKIVRGEVQWCQGYSEPGAGSDLASLRTRAQADGDQFVINGQKIWTSGGMTADWMFALVRTDPDAPKHDGISFVLFTMDQPGVSVRPIRLISGNSPFCETFLDNVIASKADLVGELNKGWTVAKRLLQFERSGIGGLSGGQRGSVGSDLVDVARKYFGSDKQGRIDDVAARERVLQFNVDSAAFRLTVKRVTEENKSNRTPGDATSIFKLVGATLQRDGADLKRDLMGTRGVGWDSDIFEPDELEATRQWLWSRTTTIYGGTNEVQRNIIAKRVLGLPD